MTTPFKGFIQIFLFISVFALSGGVAAAQQDTLSGIEIVPTTPEGKALQEFVAKKLTYPINAQLNHISGCVVGMFNVDENGEIVSRQILQSVHPLLDKEVLRVMKNIPSQIIKPIQLQLGAGPYRLPVWFTPANLDTMLTVDQLPSFPGGEPEFRKFLRMEVRWPEEAQKQKIRGTVEVRLNVTPEGLIAAPAIQHSVSDLLSQEALRVVGKMPTLIPALRKGKPVASQLCIQIPIGIEQPTSQTSSIDSIPFVRPDRMPVFRNGLNDLLSYLQKNIYYPSDELANKTKSAVRVQVCFVIGLKGEVTDAYVLKSDFPDSGFDAEALRVVRRMPNWTPAMQEGHPVRVRYTLPITFRR